MKKPLLIILVLLVFVVSGISFLVSRARKKMFTDYVRMDQKLEQIAYPLEKENDSLLQLITDPDMWHKAQEVSFLTKDFKKYLESVKLEMLGEKDSENYELMDQPNNMFFTENGLSQKGKEFITRTNELRENLIALVETPRLKTKINNTLSTGQVRDRDGRRRNWLEVNFKDFPLIASIKKLTRMQSDVSKIEASIYRNYLMTR
ncbi:hypothetical protein D1818_18040 [Aquimarina sp. BL5]|uniref:hypothetical protein n=1 Tax=Aquimarina sp. BL5 TaxID=1714860 RepID=UPI000E4AF702|nr:hypothetical protein [Aquimarina sp. BL5]AXT52641.1 hypothetical protein D1818_18040 [Aquimarina sp. BL5]RKN11705.1 hypothetical protein D7036_00740 [Aquimarina sp. BL5]